MTRQAIHFHSTRGGDAPVGFDGAVLAGLAHDGGLYVPDRLPHFSADALRSLRHVPYHDLAAQIMAPLMAGAIAADEVSAICRQTYAGFSHSAVAPLIQIDARHWLLELFHGPTFAFKDFALQLLGRLFDRLLDQAGPPRTILGATSGDTGSATIEGCKGRERLRIVMLHPKGRTSDIQRRQMTTVDAPNVVNIAIDGDFDDCQRLVKEAFGDPDFRQRHRLAAANSINFARVMAQCVYYFHAGLALGAPERRVSFAVPTGNLGDALAGHYARAMGLPIERIIIATNRNDILTRTVESGSYQREALHPTLSPSMDIQVASNFERLLYDLSDQDAVAVRGAMADLRAKGGFRLSNRAHARLREGFAARRVDDETTLLQMRLTHDETGLCLDPHGAVGLAAARHFEADLDTPIITLATAHPAKFPDAVARAIGRAPPPPAVLEAIMTKPERYHTLSADIDALKAFMDHPPQ